MSADFVLPHYGHSTLAEVMPSIASRLGLDTRAPLAVPEADHYVLAMVDGLGYELVAEHRQRAPFLSSLFDDAMKLTCAVPSTTVTSLTTLGTGRFPGEHGMAGYSFRYAGEYLNALAWRYNIDPVAFHPYDTVFEQLAPLSQVTTVSLAGFDTSGLTRTALRGGDFVGLINEDDPRARIEAVVEASQTPGSFVYSYERRLDHIGHSRGCTSSQWRDTLDMIDDELEQLFAALPPNTCLVITGDHGMVDVDADHTIMIEDDSRMTSDVNLIAGEGRFRQVYTYDPVGVARRWSSVLADRAVVKTRDEAIEAGWFANVSDDVADRWGDVLVAMTGTWALMTYTLPRELSLVGQHGSLTPAEMFVPLMCAVTS